MSDLTVILVMGALLGVALILAVVMLAGRRRDHLRQEGESQDQSRTAEFGVER